MVVRECGDRGALEAGYVEYIPYVECSRLLALIDRLRTWEAVFRTAATILRVWSMTIWRGWLSTVGPTAASHEERAVEAVAAFSRISVNIDTGTVTVSSGACLFLLSDFVTSWVTILLKVAAGSLAFSRSRIAKVWLSCLPWEELHMFK